MMLAVALVVNASFLVWQNVVAFVNAFAKFGGFVKDAKKADENASVLIDGVAAAKRLAREIVADSAMGVKGPLQAFASAEGNVQLYDSVNFTRSSIMYGKSSAAIANCEVIYSAASANLADLADFGINANTLQNYRDNIDAFQLLLSAPRNAIAARSMFLNAVTKNLNDADTTLLTEVDKLMELFKDTAPDFYAQYFKDRKLVHGATNFTEVIATIFVAGTQTPVPNASMSLVSINPEVEASYTDISNVDGVATEK